MERKKLARDKIVEGATYVLLVDDISNEAFSDIVSRSEVFLYSLDSALEVKYLLWGDTYDQMLLLAKPPYPITWVEYTDIPLVSIVLSRREYCNALPNFTSHIDPTLTEFGFTEDQLQESNMTISLMLNDTGGYQVGKLAVIQTPVPDGSGGGHRRMWCDIAPDLKAENECPEGVTVSEKDSIENMKQLLSLPKYMFMSLAERSSRKKTEVVTASGPLNKSRRARGKPPLGNYTYVLGLSTQGKSGSQKGASCVSAHTVRGHFKRRKSGVYWWNPHIAGAGEVKHRDAYILKGDSKC